MADPAHAAARLARLVFGIAGVYGLLVLLPFYFAEPLYVRQDASGFSHPELYGFLGAAAVMQLVYLPIACAPLRFRPLMPVAVLTKLASSRPWQYCGRRGESRERLLPPLRRTFSLARHSPSPG